MIANHTNKRLFSIVCLVMTAVMAFADGKNRMISKYLTVDDGLTSNKVYDMTQDNDGFLWMATAYGLCQFDGYTFNNYYFLGYADFSIQANMGNIFLDKDNNLLWARTAMYTYSCYDLKHRCFVNFAGENDIHQSYRRCMQAKSGFWMYDDYRIRHVACQNGVFQCHDISRENGKLPGGKIIRLVEDSQGGIWVITDQDVFTVEADHSLKTVLSGIPISRGCSWGGQCFFLTKDNRVIIFGEDKRQKRIVNIPKEVGRPGSQNGNFIWNDKWVIFAEDATVIMDFKSLTFSSPPDCQTGSNAMVLDDCDGDVCVSSNNGSLFLFLSNGKVRQLDLMTGINITTGRNRKFSTAKGPDGKFYIASYGNGLFIYDPSADTTEHHLSSDTRPLIATDYLLDITFDQSGCLWVSQEDAGISRIHITGQIEEGYYQPKPGTGDSGANHVYMLYRKKDGTVMVSTRDNHLYRLDMTSGQFTLDSSYKSSPFSYIEDRQGHIWVGTRNNGFFIDGQQYTRLDSIHFFPAVAVYDIAVDRQDRIWIATWEHGLFLTSHKEGETLKFRQFLNSDMNENRINDIDIDKNGRMWIATYNGLYSVDTNKKNITDKDFTCYNTQNKMLPINEIHCMMVASDGTLWIGGMGTGALHLDVSRMEKPIVETFGTKQGLPNFNVYSFVEDKEGNVWIATEGKLARMDKQSGAIEEYEMGNNIQSNLYSQNCALWLDDGRLLFGTANGVAVVNPKAVDRHKTKSFTANTTGIAVNGTLISQGEKMAEHFDGRTIQLTHRENTIRIYFSNFDYAHIESAMYQFYLEGYEKGWNEPTSESSVEYGNLTPGDYTFHLRTVNGRIADKNETALTIIIHQPWWNTWWAWLLYVSMACIIAYYLFKGWRDRFNLHQQMKVDKQVNQFRIDFFTHVAHEFRTPLSIITGAADKMTESSPQTITRKTIQTVKRGSRRLSQLVNQLMEFQKVDTDNFKLRIKQDDIIAFIRDIFQDFWNMAQQKQQNISFTPFDKSFQVAFDHHIVDTVVYNLLSNAIKYTPDKGNISMKLAIDREHSQLVLTVDDNGQGISAERQQKLFHPFMEGEASPGGIGIGLYTAKKMAQAHKGDLTYEQLENGSRFSFLIPSDDTEYVPEDYKKDDDTPERQPKEDRKSEPMIKELMPQAMNDHKVVVIEDDPDMLDLIMSELGVYFNTVGFNDGKTGYEQVVELQPSIVICDVSLGDTTGYDVVKKIKDNPLTTHIPAIMLTGHDGEDYIIKGYKAGADDYMVKPCNFNVLIARMAQLIKWGEQEKDVARQLQEKSHDTGEDTTGQKENGQTAQSGNIITSRSDKMFLEKMNTIMQQHIDDPDFTMDQLAQLMNMGRTKFYGKAKELTGLSPNKYLLSERMKLAGKLLYTGEYNVSEVCYKVGIQDLSYFNKCFKAAYGVTPSKYGK